MSDIEHPRDTFEGVLNFADIDGGAFDVTIKPHAGTRVVRIDTPTTRALRDLVGAMFDMKRVAELCREYVAVLDKGSSRTLEDALWMSAIVLYARCFNGGVRQSLDTAVLDSIPGESRKIHEHFIDLRDKFVAHSVNAYEQTLAFAIVSTETGEALRTGTSHFWANPMNPRGAETLEQMARAFHNAAELERDRLEKLAEIEAVRMDAATLAGLPDLAVDTPSVAKGSRRRRA